MTTSIARSSHTLSLLDGEIVEESDLGRCGGSPPTTCQS